MRQNPPSSRNSSLDYSRYIPGESSPSSPPPTRFRKVTFQESHQWFWGTSSFAPHFQSWLNGAARHQIPVLVVGETGTGKEVAARALHEERRAQLGLNPEEAPFIAINCGAIPENLAESLLFGHERGAFTSARERQSGRFELARKGVFFLDEVQALSPACQVKLLRVIQHRLFERLGSKSSTSLDCQVVVASGTPLEKLVAEGKFRRDLYYRLNVWPLYLPSLRNRLEDFESILRGLSQKISEQIKSPARPLHPDALEMLRKHPWPGNIRELEHVLLYSSLRSEEEIRVEHLPPYLRGELEAYLKEGFWN